MVKPAQAKHHRPLRTSNAPTNPERQVAKNKTHMRDNATIRRLKMYNTKPVRDRGGKILGGQFMSRDTPQKVRIQPSSTYFENAHTVGQKQLEEFRAEMGSATNDPYKFVVKQSKVPWSLLSDPSTNTKMDLTSVEPFEETFGAKAKRKRPKIAHFSYEELAKATEEKQENYDPAKDSNFQAEFASKKLQKDPLFDKGQSKRIWAELYKVVDSSDVIVEVLDARDPTGTRCPHIEEHLKKHRKTKHLILVLNKCDLIPSWVTKRWITTLSAEFPTLAMHSSLTNPFGKGSLIQLLRQFGALHKDRKQISVGFIGYPNVGKSSLINTLRAKKVCSVAPIPGETKVWQYITLFKRIFLIDCPGVVYPSGDSETDIVLKGVTRVENLEAPQDYIAAIMERCKPDYLRNLYKVSTWEDDTDFLSQIAKRTGKLLKKGEPDLKTVAKMILHDWQRGRIPYFVPPPPLPQGEAVPAKAVITVKKEGPEGEEEEELPEVKQNLKNLKSGVEWLPEDDPYAEQELSEDEAEDGVDYDELYADLIGGGEKKEEAEEEEEEERGEEEQQEEKKEEKKEEKNATRSVGKKKKEEKQQQYVAKDDDEDDADESSFPSSFVQSATKKKRVREGRGKANANPAGKAQQQQKVESQEKEKEKGKEKGAGAMKTNKTVIEENRLKMKEQQMAAKKEKKQKRKREEEEEDAPIIRKKNRMTTNKKKSSNFYDNVRNEKKAKKARRSGLQEKREKSNSFAFSFSLSFYRGVDSWGSVIREWEDMVLFTRYHVARVEWGVLVLGLLVGITELVLILTIDPAVKPLYLNDPTYWNQEKDNTIEMWEVVLYSFICLLVLIFCELGAPHPHSPHDTQFWVILRLSLMGVVMLLLVSGTTELLKIIVGGLRPAFARGCFGNEAIPPQSYSPLVVTSNDQCPGDMTNDDLNKLRKSFPSGHTSFAFGASVYLSLYLFWKGIQLRGGKDDGEGRSNDEGVTEVEGDGGGLVVSQLVSVCGIVPLWCAWLVGVSRIVDNKHFASDVVGGALLGSMIAAVCFW
eukprot:CAMPEP_0201516088 /NCGR_PEP_ID=MMETSP0161_2-20130828/7495_1 /ASSEMBLY_ACC=CAM_ASM_000251 /TAXON_ID=180227 /ORGANISM="Neoparamoeba aestuarina, Strain SoJaBio B1-5/56/2" /LENGTH=1035 /DNA_ID=CAMNT_0047913101 /DNA_START=79 /DNA_END=3184 /DNA_ORIENTATION=+